ncbi:lamin tail domain-containing protein [Archangium sp.]|uniref:lamin tail domain-containing protein n=1 Tax=Archangium sp. TaxID=1872627 RepID=UPI002D6F3426|nr:lamin tail domain-containing protein [Archangium sp.]HYO52164.1 lamin tail domain-containing protein [Archangium sp.]
MSNGTFTITAVITPAKVILNEILANEPGSATDGEFVELVNVGGTAIDISGWVRGSSQPTASRAGVDFPSHRRRRGPHRARQSRDDVGGATRPEPREQGARGPRNQVLIITGR